MIRTLSICLMTLALVAPAALAQDTKAAASDLTVTTPTFHNVNCPIMGKPVSTKLFVETTSGRIYMCCKACTKKIQADPAGVYKAAYPNPKKVGNKTCPISGEALGEKATTVSVLGHEIGICCEGCSKAVVENSVVIVAKLTNPKVVDFANKTCPVTGKPVAANTFVLIGDNLVHLASADAVEQAQKEPKKVLDKAKEIRAAEEKAGGGEKKQHGPNAGGCCEGKKKDEGCCEGGKTPAKGQ